MSLLVGASLALTACNDNSTVAVGPAPIRAVTVMTGAQVVPPVTVTSTASAEATLTGSSLVVSGRFDNLEGPLRDFTVDPVDNPDLNARLTSAVHIHMGPAGDNGPFQFPLTVSTTDRLSGTFTGSFTLSDAQVTSLRNQGLYYDIHTAANRPGELRGQIIPQA